MFYRNNSFVAKTFYGVTFQPGQICEVPGYINHKSFCIVDAPNPKEPPKIAEKPTKSEQPIVSKKEEPTVDEPIKEEMKVQPKESKRKYQRKDKSQSEDISNIPTDTAEVGKVDEVETKSEKEENV